MRQFIKIVENVQGDPAAIINRARALGFNGFGGLCFEAAVAINRVVFDGRGEFVGAFNEALHEFRLLGHVAVLVDGAYWDVDGYPKHEEDITSWGMLDFADPDYTEYAKEVGVEWTEDTASDVGLWDLSESEVLNISGTSHLEQMIALLNQAKNG